MGNNYASSRRDFLKFKVGAFASLLHPRTSAARDARRIQEKRSDQSFVSDSPKLRTKVVVMGGGIAGLTCAHELLIRGYQVTLIEKDLDVGGKARTVYKDLGTTFGIIPLEHGLRLFFDYYSHLPETMNRIPFGRGTVKDNLVPVSRYSFLTPSKEHIELPIFDWTSPFVLFELLQFFASSLSLRLSRAEISLYCRKIKTLFSLKSKDWEKLDSISWYDFMEAEGKSSHYQEFLVSLFSRHVVATDPRKISARSCALTTLRLLKDLASGHQGKVLNGPITEKMMSPWRNYLLQLGLDLKTGCEVAEIDSTGNLIEGIYYRNRRREVHKILGDFYISCMPKHRLEKLISLEMGAHDPQLLALHNLDTEWMSCAQIFLDRNVSSERKIVGCISSPWGLSFTCKSGFWNLPRNLNSLKFTEMIAVDVTDWNTPGSLIKKPAKLCTAEELKKEILAQFRSFLSASESKRFAESNQMLIELDPFLEFLQGGASSTEPMVVNTVNSLRHRPRCATNISNFFLAGDYVRSFTDMQSMEAANETAKEAVNFILKSTNFNLELCTVHGQ